MLIIAQPKSASTSLMSGLANILYIRGIQEKQLRKQFGVVGEFRALPHSDMAYIPHNYLARWVKSYNIYKQHLSPIKMHLDILNKLNGTYVVLLRDPLGTYNAYSRSHELTSFVRQPQNKNMVIEQLTLFRNIYVDFCSHNSKFLVIYYEDLIKEQAGHMNIILEFLKFSIRVPEFYKLPKLRYTRD